MAEQQGGSAEEHTRVDSLSLSSSQPLGPANSSPALQTGAKPGFSANENEKPVGSGVGPGWGPGDAKRLTGGLNARGKLNDLVDENPRRPTPVGQMQVTSTPHSPVVSFLGSAASLTHRGFHRVGGDV